MKLTVNPNPHTTCEGKRLSCRGMISKVENMKYINFAESGSLLLISCCGDKGSTMQCMQSVSQQLGRQKY